MSFSAKPSCWSLLGLPYPQALYPWAETIMHERYSGKTFICTEHVNTFPSSSVLPPQHWIMVTYSAFALQQVLGILQSTLKSVRSCAQVIRLYANDRPFHVRNLNIYIFRYPKWVLKSVPQGQLLFVTYGQSNNMVLVAELENTLKINPQILVIQLPNGISFNSINYVPILLWHSWTSRRLDSMAQ